MIFLAIISPLRYTPLDMARATSGGIYSPVDQTPLPETPFSFRVPRRQSVQRGPIVPLSGVLKLVHEQFLQDVGTV